MMEEFNYNTCSLMIVEKDRADAESSSSDSESEDEESEEDEKYFIIFCNR